MAAKTGQKLSLFTLSALVVGSMVGAGIFSLPRTFGQATGPFGAVIAWCIAAGVFAEPSSCPGNPATGESTDVQ